MFTTISSQRSKFADECKLANAAYNHLLYRAATMFRGAAIGLIYNRTMSLRDGVYDEAAAVTLQSTDIERLLVSLISVNVGSRSSEMHRL